MIDLSLNEQEINGLSQEEQEIAMARKLELLILPHLKRHIDFFYGSANMQKKAKAYKAKINKKEFEENFESTVTPTSCKSLCMMVTDILKDNGLQADTVSCDTDIFRHTDVVLTTSSRKKYIINYLEDMERVQSGMTTPDFASLKYYKRRYEKFEGKLTTDGKSLEGINFLDTTTLSKIDRNLGYKQQEMYMDEVIQQIKTEFANFRQIMAENKWIETQYQLEKENPNITQEEKESQKSEIYDKYNRMTSEEELEAKLDWIFNYFNDRMNINGHTDFVMYYSQILLKGVLNDEEYQKITRYDGFIQRKKIKEDNPIIDTLDLENPENAKKVRFCMVGLENGTSYVFSRKPNSYTKLNPAQVEELQKNSKISKTEKPSDLVLYLCDRGNALPLVFHQMGSKILNERAKLIPESLSEEQRKQEIKELADAIETTDEPLTSILIPYPDGSIKYLYINEKDEFVVKTKDMEEIYHYNDNTDEFNIEKVTKDEEER